jgi:hypothetical protein
MRFKTGPCTTTKSAKVAYTPPTVFRQQEALVELEVEAPEQTFPGQNNTDVVIRQTNHDLTCGMRSLQNIYGRHIVSRQEMDDMAKNLEKKAYGEELYDPNLGLYSIEVLESILKSKSKAVQRIALEKIPSAYYLKAIQANSSLAGYIVAIGQGSMKHYIAVRYHSGNYRIVDSIPGVHPKDVDAQILFKKRSNGKIYCTMDNQDRRPVVALLAVASTPFVEYHIMHNTWRTNGPSPEIYMNAIYRVMRENSKFVRTKARAAGNTVTNWYNKLKTARTLPPESCDTFITQFINDEISDEMTILVEMGDQRTAIRTKSIDGLISDLLSMRWIFPNKPFYFQQNGQFIRDEDDNEVEHHSEGLLTDYNIEPCSTLTLLVDHVPQIQAQIGGFYTFNCVIEGTCISHQNNSYSVRDRDGNVHIVYKGSISNMNKQ